ncbi:MAG: divalent-cation tolerance protein CutA [Desulfobacteraceae bacterium]
MEYSIVITTTDSKSEAESLSAKLLENRLAACIQVSSVTSFYTWKDEVHNDPEYKLLIKTRKELYPDLASFIREHHSYEVPEIIEVPIRSGLDEYLGWIAEVTGESHG